MGSSKIDESVKSGPPQGYHIHKPSKTLMDRIAIWIPMVLVIIGWVFFGGQYLRQQELNTRDIANIEITMGDLETRQTQMEGQVSSVDARLSKVEDALGAIGKIQQDVGVIKNDQAHIQSGIQRVEGEVKDIRRTVTFGKAVVTASDGG